MRSLVPGLDRKIDKAGALEMAAEYVIALQNACGGNLEQEFLQHLEENKSSADSSKNP